MKKRIFTICDKLAEQGIKPTLIRVRIELGGGSFSTINPLLKQWKENRIMGDTLAISNLRNEIAAISQKATTLMWKAANDHCNKIKTDQQDELITLRIKVAKADVTIGVLRRELEEVSREKAILERKLSLHQSTGKQAECKLITENCRKLEGYEA